MEGDVKGHNDLSGYYLWESKCKEIRMLCYEVLDTQRIPMYIVVLR